jgi:hypothetical protein
VQWRLFSSNPNRTTFQPMLRVASMRRHNLRHRITHPMDPSFLVALPRLMTAITISEWISTTRNNVPSGLCELHVVEIESVLEEALKRL